MEQFYKQLLNVTTANFHLDCEGPLVRLKKSYLKCELCNLCLNRVDGRQIVFGIGQTNSKVMLIGESPSDYDSDLGSPFSDNIGIKVYGLVSYLSKYMNLTNNIYFTNAVLCPGHPEQENFNACRKRLEEEIKLVNPKVIIFLGVNVALLFVDPVERLEKLIIKLDKYYVGVVTKSLRELFVKRDDVKYDIKQDLDFVLKVLKNG